jgi:hypothetical protein
MINDRRNASNTNQKKDSEMNKEKKEPMNRLSAPFSSLGDLETACKRCPVDREVLTLES